MNLLVILGHPSPASFNAAIARTVVETLKELGHTVRFHDLYAEAFPSELPAEEILTHAPVAEVVSRHCKELAEADGIVIVHPNWWGMPPAVVTGWVDRVFRPEVAYRFVGEDGGEGVPEGLLKARKAIVFNTSNTNETRENEVFGDPLERIWRDCIFDLCGITDVERRMFRIIVTSTEEERQGWLDEVRQMMRRSFPG